MTVFDLLGWGMAHAHCVRTDLVAALLVASHILVGVSYLLISPAMLTIRDFVPSSSEMSRSWSRFSWFIGLCGLSHICGALTYYLVPAYNLEAAVLGATAVVSTSTAWVFLRRLRPQIIELLATLKDVTATDTLKAALDRHRRTFLDSPIGILCVDEVGDIIETNTRFAEWMEVPSRLELERRPFISLVHPDDRPATDTMFRACREGKVSLEEEEPFRNRYVTARGNIVTLEWQRGSGQLVGDQAHVAFCFRVAPV